MTSADIYRSKAAQFSALAQSELSRKLQLEYARMAASYFRLAELAERNAGTDAVYGTSSESVRALRNE